MFSFRSVFLEEYGSVEYRLAYHTSSSTSLVRKLQLKHLKHTLKFSSLNVCHYSYLQYIDQLCVKYNVQKVEKNKLKHIQPIIFTDWEKKKKSLQVWNSALVFYQASRCSLLQFSLIHCQYSLPERRGLMTWKWQFIWNKVILEHHQSRGNAWSYSVIVQHFISILNCPLDRLPMETAPFFQKA